MDKYYSTCRFITLTVKRICMLEQQRMFTQEGFYSKLSSTAVVKRKETEYVNPSGNGF